MRIYHGVGIDDTGRVNVKYKGKSMVWVNPAFQRWKGILKRCYGPASKKSKGDLRYKGVAVCDEWLKFSAFEEWMLAQDWSGNDIDKDFLSLDKKIYSPETCAFLPKEINYFLGSSPDRKGDWPLGVSFDRSRGKYSAYARVEGKSKGLGRFDCPSEAHKKYQTAKLEVGERLFRQHLGRVDERALCSMRAVLDKIGDDLALGRETKSLHPIDMPDSYKKIIRDRISKIP